jgi:hypothetical protein
VGHHGIREFRRVVQGGYLHQHFGGDLLAELRVVLEGSDDVADQRLGMGPPEPFDRVLLDAHLEIPVVRQEMEEPRPEPPVDQHLDGAVGKLQDLDDVRDGPDADPFGRRER